MLIPPKYSLTRRISQHLASIEASREIIDTIAIPHEVETNIRRQSTLKSSLFSARIEGNTLTLDEVSTRSSKDRKKVEVFNILKALTYIRHKQEGKVTKKEILKLHKIIMDGLTVELGRFRREVSAIFNAAGVAVYMPPPPRQIPDLLEKLLRFANSVHEQSVPIEACLVHFTFEKIHPFLDGNGRVGRVLLQYVLHKGGYGMKGLLSLEEYLDKNRTLYFRGLEAKENYVTEYVEFMLEQLAQAAQIAKKLVLEKKDYAPEDSLLPRRLEILNIIRDHKIITFDQLRRRFLGVNERTLRYDLKKIKDGGFIRKRGVTKGVVYEGA